MTEELGDVVVGTVVCTIILFIFIIAPLGLMWKMWSSSHDISNLPISILLIVVIIIGIAIICAILFSNTDERVEPSRLYGTYEGID